MSNIIDKIQVSGVTYQIQGSGGGGITSGEVQTMIDESISGKVNVSDNVVSGITLNNGIIVNQVYQYGDINQFWIESIDPSDSGSIYLSLDCWTSSSEASYFSIEFEYSGTSITAVTSSSQGIYYEIVDGKIRLSLETGYYLRRHFYGGSSVKIYCVATYQGGQSAEVLNTSVNEALNDINDKTVPNALIRVNDTITNDGYLATYGYKKDGTSNSYSIRLYDNKTLKYDSGSGLYVNFSGSTAHTAYLNTGSGGYCGVPQSMPSYEESSRQMGVQFNSGYTGSFSTFYVQVRLRDYNYNTYTDTYVYDVTANTLTFDNGSGRSSVTKIPNTYNFFFYVKQEYTPSCRISQIRENNYCSICGVDSTAKNDFIITGVTVDSYDYNGQEMIDSINAKLANKQNTLSAGTGIQISGNVISATGSSIEVSSAITSGDTNPVQGGVLYDKFDEVEQVTAAALNELNEAVSGKQDTLVSGTNIKTINNTSILGSGNIDIQGGGGTVESAITSGSTNAVESKAIWSATTFNKGVLLTFNGYGQSTNYPEGCGKLVVGNIGSYDNSDITFRNNGGRIGRISIENSGNISVDTSRFEGATATVDGNKVTIIYPSTGITSVEVINTRWTYTAVVEGAWVNENTYMKLEVDAIANGLQNNINSKLDATAYTPTVVDSALYAGSQNPVKNQALYSELRIDNGETETTLAFENRYSTNYPNGCTKLNVEVVGSNNNSDINFYSGNNQRLGYITIDNWGSIDVNVYFDGASYEISGTTVIITYPTVTNVTKIEVNNYGNYVFKAIVANATPLIDQVTANTTALGAVESRIAEDEEVTAAALNELNDNFGGLKLVKLSQAEYNALAAKDSSTLYIIVN